MKKVEDIMKPYSASCELSDTIDVAENKLFQSRSEFLPVVDQDKRVVGIIRHNDIARYSQNRQVNAPEAKVNQIMSPVSFAINGQEDEATAYSTMKNEKLNRLPVVDDENHLKGSVSFMSIARRIVNFKRSLGKFKPGRTGFRPDPIT